jgi:hypothetical protein
MALEKLKKEIKMTKHNPLDRELSKAEIAQILCGKCNEWKNLDVFVKIGTCKRLYCSDCIKIRKHPLYSIWVGMRRRCRDKKLKDYHRYGGRGIIVCDLWDCNYNPFYYWAIKNGWATGLQIDRKNNNEGYIPENSRFVSRKTNSNNRRRNVLIEYNGQVNTLAQWAEIQNIEKAALYKRYYAGKTGSDLLNPKNAQRKHFMSIKSQYKPATEWAIISGIPYTTIKKRMGAGMSSYTDILSPTKGTNMRLFNKFKQKYL